MNEIRWHLSKEIKPEIEAYKKAPGKKYNEDNKVQTKQIIVNKAREEDLVIY